MKKTAKTVAAPKDPNAANANGKLRHHFLGTYYASMALMFESPEKATYALGKLGGLWRQAEQNPCALIWHGNSEALESCKAVLASFGADAKKIDSVAKSIDFGEPFSISIPVA